MDRVFKTYKVAKNFVCSNVFNVIKKGEFVSLRARKTPS